MPNPTPSTTEPLSFRDRRAPHQDSKALPKHPGYYEAIIQLRPKDGRLLGYVGTLLSKMNIPVTRVEDFRYGHDIFLADKKQIGTIGRMARHAMGCETTISRSLHTKNRQSSKYVYRVTLLCRMPRLQDEEVV